MSDFKAQFKAARASRGSGSSAKMSKEQIKALKAQRASAEAKAAVEAAKQRAKQEAARVAAAAAPPIAAPAASSHPASSSAPRAAPPPKFAPAAPPKFGASPALTSDSQVHSGGSSVSTANLQSTASEELSPAAGPNYSAAQQSTPADLPAGFFEAPDEAATSLPAGFFDAPENGAASGSQHMQPAAPSIADDNHSSLPAGFFEAPADISAESSAPVAPLPQPTTSKAAQPKEQPGIIPKGFFADKDADAKARGEDVKKKSKEEEFSEFMSSIAVDVREAEERDQEAAADAATERADREQFEQRMRLQRLEELKTGSSEAQKQAAAYTLSDVVLDVDAILDEALQPKKRHKIDVKQILEPAAEGEESSDEDLELDWRAKTS